MHNADCGEEQVTLSGCVYRLHPPCSQTTDDLPPGNGCESAAIAAPLGPGGKVSRYLPVITFHNLKCWRGRPQSVRRYAMLARSVAAEAVPGMPKVPGYLCSKVIQAPTQDLTRDMPDGRPVLQSSPTRGRSPQIVVGLEWSSLERPREGSRWTDLGSMTTLIGGRE